jgi:STE24 endopeptidase
MAFDPELATQAWMATLNGAARAKSDAYFEGGYWLTLWGALAAITADLVILRLGWAAGLSARVRRLTTNKPLQSFLFALPYLLLAALLVLPLTIYEEFFREKQYGLLNQGFAEWGGEALMALGINALVFGLLFMGIHAAIRRSPKGWWVGGHRCHHRRARAVHHHRAGLRPATVQRLHAAARWPGAQRRAVDGARQWRAGR